MSITAEEKARLIEALQAKMKEGGHRLWASSAKTRNTTKSGTAVC